MKIRTVLSIRGAAHLLRVCNTPFLFQELRTIDFNYATYIIRVLLLPTYIIILLAVKV